MGFLTSGFFWAIVLIIFGVLILVKNFFNLNIPIGRIFLGVFVILVGIMIITNSGSKSENSKKWVFWGEDRYHYDNLFCKMNINLTDLSALEENKKIEINTIFAQSKVLINPNIPMIFEVSSAFAAANLPDGNIITFGKNNFKTEAFDEKKPYYIVETNVVFGQIIIKEK